MPKKADPLTPHKWRRLGFPPRPSRWAVATIVGAVVGLYWVVLPAPFLAGDLPAIVDNASLRHGLWAALFGPAGGGISMIARPVLNLSFALNYSLGGLQVVGYHGLNILIHAAAALALYGVVRRTCRGDTLFAWACALLWAVHPLLTAAVSYTLQRAESLMGFFFLFAFYGFIRAADLTTPSLRPASPGAKAVPTKDRRAGWIWFALSGLACLLGMGTHQVMCSAPFLLPLYDRTFLSASWREVVQRRWKWHTLYLATLIWCLWLAAESHQRGGTYGFGVVSWWKYAGAEFPAFAHYLRLVVWPAPLVLNYGNQYVTSGWQVVPGACWLAAFTAVALSTFYRPTPASFLAIFLLEILEPTTVVPNLGQTAAESRMYLGLAPLVIAAVWLLQAVLARRRPGLASGWAAFRTRPKLQPAARLSFCLIVVALASVLGAATVARNRDYLWHPVRVREAWPPLPGSTAPTGRFLRGAPLGSSPQ